MLKRATREGRCPICGGAKWCGYSGDRTLAVCMRIEEGSLKPTANGGWLHVLKDSPDWRDRPRPEPKPKEPPPDWTDQANERAAATTDEQLAHLAARLGLPLEPLRRLGAFWSEQIRGWGFPMRSPSGQVIGIRTRFRDGSKKSVKGSRSGLFIPAGTRDAGELLIAEGESDTAALLGLGFDCIGRPGCMAVPRLAAEFAQGRPTVVVADRDEQGQRGARELAKLLLLHCPEVAIWTPPRGDAREWVVAGATRRDLESSIRNQGRPVLVAEVSA